VKRTAVTANRNGGSNENENGPTVLGWSEYRASTAGKHLPQWMETEGILHVRPGAVLDDFQSSH
jgi:hypothetical protein